jgi:hypothetical protein
MIVALPVQPAPAETAAPSFLGVPTLPRIEPGTTNYA